MDDTMAVEFRDDDTLICSSHTSGVIDRKFNKTTRIGIHDELLTVI